MATTAKSTAFGKKSAFSKSTAFGKKSAFSKSSAFGVHTVGANITYYQHIKPLFTQWDQVQMATNVEVGRGQFDLWSYADVQQRADKILEYLKPPAGSMPKYIGPWSEQDINLFQAWIDNGCIEGDPPKTPEIPDDPHLEAFIALSQELTGFDDLKAVMEQVRAPNPGLASIYLYRLKTESTDSANADKMLKIYATQIESHQSSERAEQLEAKIVNAFPVLVADINRLWYGAYLHDQSGNAFYGTPDFNQYIYALVWLNGGAHPMGYATYADNTKSNPPGSTDFYWARKPTLPDPKTQLFTKDTGN